MKTWYFNFQSFSRPPNIYETTFDRRFHKRIWRWPKQWRPCKKGLFLQTKQTRETNSTKNSLSWQTSKILKNGIHTLLTENHLLAVNTDIRGHVDYNLRMINAKLLKHLLKSDFHREQSKYTFPFLTLHLSFDLSFNILLVLIIRAANCSS